MRLEGSHGVQADPLAVGQAMERHVEVGVDEGDHADLIEDGAHAAAGVGHDEEPLGGRRRFPPYQRNALTHPRRRAPGADGAAGEARLHRGVVADRRAEERKAKWLGLIGEGKKPLAVRLGR